MQIISRAFVDGETMPKMYGRNHDNVNPPLTFLDVPVGAQSLALIVEDPDAPGGMFTHWIVYDLPPTTTKLSPGELPALANQGKNDFGEQNYGGPQPPSGRHRYIFTLFALDRLLGNRGPINRDDFYHAVESTMLDRAQLVGLFAAEDNK